MIPWLKNDYLNDHCENLAFIYLNSIKAIISNDILKLILFLQTNKGEVWPDSKLVESFVIEKGDYVIVSVLMEWSVI